MVKYNIYSQKQKWDKIELNVDAFCRLASGITFLLQILMHEGKHGTCTAELNGNNQNNSPLE